MIHKTLRVMLVDDSPERLELLREQLLIAGYTVIAEVGNTINLSLPLFFGYQA
jgi:CheY-like chemotaxis protein